jgi:hypothetical protein
VTYAHRTGDFLRPGLRPGPDDGYEYENGCRYLPQKDAMA